jgi:hypothetical protein
MEEMELNELAGVYCVDGVFKLDGVENTGAACSNLAPVGERVPEPLEDGWETGGED